MKMKYALVVAILALVLGSCATLAPVQDPDPAPAPLEVRTMELQVCGALSVGTGACAFQSGTAVSGSIQVRVPRTNTSNTPAKVEFVSEACNIDDVESGLPGAIVSVPLVTFLGATANKSCSIQIQMTLVWDGQSSFTFPISPIIGQVLLYSLDHAAVSVNGDQLFPVPGYLYLTEVQRSSPDPVSTVITLDTQGSALGQIIYQGCGLSNVTQPYSEVNPTVSVPRVASSCDLFATVQRVDLGDSLSFVVHTEVTPTTYQLLQPPVLVSATEGQSDPAVSAVDLGSSVVAGGQFKIPSDIGASYYIRQITTGGRYSVSLITNNIIEWTLQ